MIPISGMGTQVGLNLIDATRDKQLTLIAKTAQNARAIQGFRERIGSVQTVDDLMADQDLYAFVMRAFDLEDQIFGKGLMKKVLQSDLSDPKSLVNRLTDPRFRELHKELAFVANGTFTTRTKQKYWQDLTVDRFVERAFINGAADQNESVGDILEFRERVGGVKTWFDVLKKPALGRFMRRALGIPDEAVRLDIDRQAKLFEAKYDIKKLQDPAELRKLERKFAAISDALDTSRLQQNGAIQMLTGILNASGGGQFVPITLDLEAISSLPRSPYR